MYCQRLVSLLTKIRRPQKKEPRNGMSLYKNLSAEEKSKVDSKIAALRDQTGHCWDYQVLDKQGQSEVTPLLEIVVDGKISQPIKLPRLPDRPAEILCREFDQYAARRT
jgi:hypothetical protein